MQPILRHTMTHPMNMVTFCLSEVRSTILTLLSSHQLDVTYFFGTAPFEANPSQPKFSRNPTFGSKTPSRLRFVSESDGYRSGFWSILVIFNIDHPIIGVSNYIVTAKFLFLMVNSLPINWRIFAAYIPWKSRDIPLNPRTYHHFDCFWWLHHHFCMRKIPWKSATCGAAPPGPGARWGQATSRNSRLPSSCSRLFAGARSLGSYILYILLWSISCINIYIL